MTSNLTLSFAAKRDIDYLKNEFAELKSACEKKINKLPAYQRWGSYALDIIAYVGGVLSAFIIISSIPHFIGDALFLIGLKLGATAIAALAIKRFVFGPDILKIDLRPQTILPNRIEFFQALEMRICTSFKDFSSAFGISRRHSLSEINVQIYNLNTHVESLENSPTKIEGFDKKRIDKLKAAIKTLHSSYIALENLESLKKGHSFSIVSSTTQGEITNELKNTIIKIDTHVQKAVNTFASMEKDVAYSSKCAIDILEEIDKKLL